MEAATWNPPERIEEYRLVRLLGQGAMGRVFLARDEVLDRLVAVKLMPETAPEPWIAERFLSEARAVARLEHPNIVPIFRIGSVEGRPFLVSRYVRGRTLDQLSRPMPPQRVLRIAIGLARGLAAAHRRGVLHRDIKLANAILCDEDGEPKLVDFGLAKRIDGADDDRVGADRPLSNNLSQTEAGSILGTPLYLAPELWLGEPATAQSDVYALGVALLILCANRGPYLARDAETLRSLALSSPPPRTLDLVPDLNRGFAAVIDRCLHPRPALRFASGEELREALELLTPDSIQTAIPDGNPYRGLDAFRAEHRSVFFGRDREIRAILDRLRAERFVLVAGDSGVGKSSLCHAGVLPRLDTGSNASDSVTALTFVPGRWPAFSFAAALAPVLETDPELLLQRLRTDVRGVATDLRSRLRAGLRPRLLIFVDQLEEVATLSDPESASLFSSILSQILALTPDLLLLGTVRADFLARLARLPGLGEEIGRALYVLQPLSQEGVREAIEQPARAHGFSFDPEALELLVAEAVKAEGLLPLLQFALAEIWTRRDEATRTIPLRAISESGGVAGALARHADILTASMSPAHREAARHVLLRMITAERTRARRTDQELGVSDPSIGAAVEALVRGRLLAVRQSDNELSYELAHEALINGWAQLRRWIDDEDDQGVTRERLANAAAEWERLGRSKDVLWGERQLLDAKRLTVARLPARDAAFLTASRRAARRRRLLRTISACAIPLVLALIYGGFQLKARADLNARIAAQLHAAEKPLSSARARSEPLDRLQTQAFSHFDRGEVEQAEKVWGEARAIAAAAEETYGKAMMPLESAVLVDPADGRARTLLASVLFERLLIVERTHNAQLRDELLQRLEVYDPNRELLDRWYAPASLSVTARPEGAEIVLRRASGELVSNFGKLSPGSYLLTFHAAGRAEVRYPVALARGEKLSVAIDLPSQGSVPEGFVYIPAGRFLAGSSKDDGLRRHFLNTVPLHSVTTDGFLIGRHEVTYADWITYLSSIPAEERSKRTPSVASQGFNGSLSLNQESAGWRLSFQIGAQRYSALEGEKLTYLGRTGQEPQNWLNFPVSGISFDDAKAYAEWLASSGRLPGARLCTELEWERAARGADDREYPHGDLLQPADANYDETYGKEPRAFGPDEAGAHPRSRSPFGVDDLVGNVWEWTSSSFSPGKSVARGGSFYHDRLGGRSTNRLTPEPSLRDLTLGLRICAGVSASRE